MKIKSIIIIGLIGIIAFACLRYKSILTTTDNLNNKTTKPSKSHTIPVKTETVAIHKINQSLTLVGYLKAEQSVDIAAEVSARITSVSVKTDQIVKKGAPLFDLDDRKAKAALEEAKAYAADELRKYNDLAKLSKRAAVSQTDVDSQKASADIAQARLDSAQADYNNHHIIAPFNGKVGFVDLNIGQLISIGTKLLNFDNTDVMFLDLSVPERYLPVLKIGQKLTANSYSWPNETFTGEISALDTRIDQNSLTIKIRTTFNNEKRHLKPGMLMSANLALPEVVQPIIPVQAIEYSGTKRFVYKVGQDHIAKRQLIVLGARIENNVVVDSGLAIGDQIIVQGLVSIHDGAQVKPITDTTKISSAHNTEALKTEAK